jgi:hypothetical protein
MARHNNVMAEIMAGAIHPELKRLIAEKADESHMTMNEFVAHVLANHLKRPDLAWVPRKKMGRPKKEKATA